MKSSNEIRSKKNSKYLTLAHNEPKRQSEVVIQNFHLLSQPHLDQCDERDQQPLSLAT